jgi:hypothetical protein
MKPLDSGPSRHSIDSCRSVPPGGTQCSFDSLAAGDLPSARSFLHRFSGLTQITAGPKGRNESRLRESLIPAQAVLVRRHAELRGGDRKSLLHAARVKLADLGISHNEFHRWQRIALVPEAPFAAPPGPSAFVLFRIRQHLPRPTFGQDFDVLSLQDCAGRIFQSEEKVV